LNSSWIACLPPFIKAKLEGRHNFQKILGNTAWLLFDKIFRMGLGLVIGIWLARYLGPNQYGLLNYVIAFVALFSAFSSLGLDGIVIRDIVRSTACTEQTLGTTFLLRLCGGTVALAVSISTLSMLRPHEATMHLLCAIIAAGMVFQAFDTIDIYFQSQVKSQYVVYAKGLAFAIVSVGKVALIYMHAPLAAFAWAGLFEVIFGSLGLITAYQMQGHHIMAWRVSYDRIKSLLRDSWPLILSGVVTMVYLRIDQVMIGNMVGNEEVGIYSAAVRLAEAWYFIPMAVVGSFFPDIVAAKSVSDELFYSKLQKLYNLMALMAYVIAIPTTLMSNWLIHLLFGPAYAKAGPMLAVLIWAGMFVNLGVARSAFLTTINWTRVHFMTVALGCLINVVLNYFLIPVYGGMGAVIASCIAYWFAAHGACFVYRPLYRTGCMLTKAIFHPRIW